MLPEDGSHKATPDPTTSAPGAKRLSRSPAKLEDIRIDGRIGTDPEELKRWADHVVAGRPIQFMEIMDLRALIEAVQAHPDARLAPVPPSGNKASIGEESTDLTELGVLACRVMSCKCQSLAVRLRFRASSTTFHREAHFVCTSFLARASFDCVLFSGRALFPRAAFVRESRFTKATFERGTSFRGAEFADRVWFDNAVFRSDAQFTGTTFDREAEPLNNRATAAGE